MRSARLPPRSDDAARTLAVLAVVAREVRRGARARMKPPRMSLAAMLASLGIIGARGSVPPYPELRLRFVGLDADTIASLHEIRARAFRHGAAPHAASAPASIGLPGVGAEIIAGPTPDFSPDFLSHVKQSSASDVPSWPSPDLIGGLSRPSKPWTPPPRAFAGRRVLAGYLGVSVDWFDRNVDRLMREEFFPRERAGGGQRRWHVETVVSWARAPGALSLLARARAAHAKTQAMKDSA